MRKALCLLLALLMTCMVAMTAQAERSKAEVELLHFMAAAALDSLGDDVTGIPEIAYNEELDVFYMVYVNDSLTAMQHKFNIASIEGYQEKTANNCRQHFCKYFFDFMDAVKLNVDIAIRHFDANGNFMYCMYNGVYQEEDIPIQK